MKLIVAIATLSFTILTQAGVIYNKKNSHEINFRLNESFGLAQLEMTYVDGGVRSVVPLKRLDVELQSGKVNVDKSFTPVLALSKFIDASGDEDPETAVGFLLLSVLPVEVALLPITLSAELIQDGNLAKDIKKIKQAISEDIMVAVSNARFNRILRILKLNARE